MHVKKMSTIWVAALLLCGGSYAGEKDCRRPEYNPENPRLEHLDISNADRQQITKLAKQGKKIAAIRIMRQCAGLSLSEQKTIVDRLFRGD